VSSVTERIRDYWVSGPGAKKPTVSDRCQWCERPLERPLWARWTTVPSCTGEAVESCLLLASAMRVDPPEPDYGLEDPPPPDLHECGACLGGGEVLVSVDWETGAPNTETCTRCVNGVVLPV